MTSEKDILNSTKMVLSTFKYTTSGVPKIVPP